LTYTGTLIKICLGLAKQNGRFVPLTKKDIARRASLAPKGVIAPLQPPTPAADQPGDDFSPPPEEAAQAANGPLTEPGVLTTARGVGWAEANAPPRHRRGRRVSLVVTSPPRRYLGRRRASLPEPRALSRQLSAAAPPPPIAWVAPNMSNRVARTSRRPTTFTAATIQPFSNAGQFYTGMHFVSKLTTDKILSFQHVLFEILTIFCIFCSEKVP
jgi:hypothetical protein